MSKKRILILISSLSIIFLLFACGEQAGQDIAEDYEASEQTELEGLTLEIVIRVNFLLFMRKKNC